VLEQRAAIAAGGVLDVAQRRVEIDVDDHDRPVPRAAGC